MQQTVQCLAAFGTTTSDHSSCKLGESETLEDQRATSLSGGVAQMQSRCDQDAKGSLSGFIDPVFTIFTDVIYFHFALDFGDISEAKQQHVCTTVYITNPQAPKRLSRHLGAAWVSTHILTTGRLMLEPPVTQSQRPLDRFAWRHPGARFVLRPGEISWTAGPKDVAFCQLLAADFKVMTSWCVEFEDGRRVKQLGLRLSSGSTGVPKCIQIAHGGATACCRFQSIELHL